METRRPFNIKIYTRAIVAILLIVTWLSSAIYGLILWLAPEVRQAGQQQLLFDITKQSWGEIHFWVCIAVVIITIAHIIIDWKALRGVLRYMTSTHRETRPIQ